MSFTLLEHRPNGQTIEHVIGAIELFQAQANSTYTLIDSKSSQTPENLILKRKGDQLEIYVDEQVVATIGDFYIEDSIVAFAPLATEGALDVEVLTLKGGANEGIDEGIVWSTGDDLSAGQWGIIGGWGAMAGVVSSGSSSSAAYVVTLAAAAGPFSSIVTVELYDKDGNLLVSKLHDFSTGDVSFTITNGYQGPILAKLIDGNGDGGDYLDEATNQLTSLGEPLRAMSEADGNGDVHLSITPLTELAVRQAGIVDIPTAEAPITEENVAVNAQIAKLFGVEDITAPVITVVEEEYQPGDGINAQEHYGEVLATLSGIDVKSGSASNSLDSLEEAISIQEDGSLAISQQGVQLLNDGVEAFSEGVNGDKAKLENAIIEPPYISVNGDLRNVTDGINLAEAQSGVSILVKNVASGDVVTIAWGNETFTTTVEAQTLSAQGSIEVTLPLLVIEAVGGGNILVTSQVGEEAISPAIIVLVDLVAPTIESGNEAATIDENSGGGQKIYTVVSTDTAEVTYSLTGTDAALLAIDASTGDVTLTANPDNETKADYSFNVVATDAVGNENSQAVTLDITDLDEVTPTVIITDDTTTAATGDVTYTFTFSEDVTGFVVTDIDITGGTKGTFNAVSATEYTLVVTPTVDSTTDITVDVAANVATDAVGNNNTVATQSVQTVDSIAPGAPVINVVSTDNLLNATESSEGFNLTGTGEAGATVSVSGFVTGVVNKTATVQSNGTWSVDIVDTDLADNGSNTLSATQADVAGNVSAAGIQVIMVDTTVVATVTLVAEITSDDIINATESGTTIAITGTVAGDFQTGDTVTLTVNGNSSYTAAVAADGSFSIDVSGSDLAADNTINASFVATDAAGNTASAVTDSETYTVDVTATSTIILDASISADDIINATESESTIAITGTVAGDFQTGDTVTLTVNDNSSYTAAVAADGSFSIDVSGSDLAADNTITASFVATDAAGNTASAVTDSETYTVDTTAIATITLDSSITTDDIINATESDSTIAITGTVAGDFQTGDTVTLTVNGNSSYTAAVAADGSFSIDVAGSDLAADTSIEASFVATDAAGNTASTVTDSETYTVDLTATATITLASEITSDDIINATESGATIAIAGTVAG
ncbi:MAG: hypothetical protein ACJAXJ_001754, partial [Colwellia sp.]